MRKKIAFLGFSFVALAMGIVGIVYLTRPTIMPYHLAAMGYDNWDQLTHGSQVMSINFMKSAATGFITYALAMFFILWFPYRSGKNWSRWALLILSVWQIGMIAYRTYLVGAHTPANPPFYPSIILLLIIVICFFIAGNSKQNIHKTT